MSKLKLAPVECSCYECKECCKRPCWGTPEDIQKIIDAGLGHRLMLDLWGNNSKGENTFIPCPALKGSEGQNYPNFPRYEEGCTFWTAEGKCELHERGLKPTEGRLTSCKRPELSEDPTLHKEIYQTWETEEGEALANKWCESQKIEPKELDGFDLIDFFFNMLKLRVEGEIEKAQES